MIFKFSFLRIVTFEENFEVLNIKKGDKAVILVTTQPKSGWIALQYPDPSEPFILRKVVGGEIEAGSVEMGGEPKVSVIKDYGEVVVTDGTLDAKYGDSRSWGKGVRFDLILGKVLFFF